MTKRLYSVILVALGLAACTQPAPEPQLKRKGSDQPFQHVVLIVIDTLRADEARAAHTPTLDALAASGGHVERAWSSGTWTGPSIVSMFLGAPIRSHGWDLPAGHIGRYPVLPDRPVLAEVLQQAGFHTTALVGNPYLTKEIGFHRGFEKWSRTTDRAMLKSLKRTFLPRLAEGGRHFLYLHLMGPHSPLKPSPEATARHGLDDQWYSTHRGLQIGAAKRNQKDGVREAYASGYRAVVEDTDARLGRILESLKPLGEDTLYIVTSDHGELLGDHGVVGHGRHVWEALTHVPMIIGGTEGIPDQLGIHAIPDLVTRLSGVQATWPTQVTTPGPLVSEREGQLALSPDGTHKWIWDGDKTLHFNLSEDPGELHPLPDTPAGAKLREKWRANTPRAAPLPLSIDLAEETREALKELGYTD